MHAHRIHEWAHFTRHLMKFGHSSAPSRCFRTDCSTLLLRLGIRHIRTRAYTPRTNGKAERFIQALLRKWAYAFIYPNSDARAIELERWMYHYNFHRPH